LINDGMFKFISGYHPGIAGLFSLPVISGAKIIEISARFGTVTYHARAAGAK